MEQISHVGGKETGDVRCVKCQVARKRTAGGYVVESSYGCDVCQVNVCKNTFFPEHLGAVLDTEKFSSNTMSFSCYLSSNTFCFIKS